MPIPNLLPSSHRKTISACRAWRSPARWRWHRWCCRLFRRGWTLLGDIWSLGRRRHLGGWMRCYLWCSRRSLWVLYLSRNRSRYMVRIGDLFSISPRLSSLYITRRNGRIWDRLRRRGPIRWGNGDRSRGEGLWRRGRMIPMPHLYQYAGKSY